MTMAVRGQAYFPGRAPVDAYGNGGFRFADMSHRGSLLILPTGIYGWKVESFSELTVESFEAVFAESEEIEFVILGTGSHQQWPSRALREAFASRGVGLEIMDTGAAVRTYNVLLAEDRRVAAALIAVEDPR
jgi:uncharacterized protein